MKTSIEDIQWRAPWRPINHPADQPALQRQLELELAKGHPLWGRDANVVGRRINSDEVVVICSDKAVAAVHLDWATGPHQKTAEYPSVIEYESLTAFQKIVDEDALEYGEND